MGSGLGLGSGYILRGRGGTGCNQAKQRRQCWVRAAAPTAGVMQASVAREAVLGSSRSATCRGGAGERGKGRSAGLELQRHQRLLVESEHPQLPLQLPQRAQLCADGRRHHGRQRLRIASCAPCCPALLALARPRHGWRCARHLRLGDGLVGPGLHLRQAELCRGRDPPLTPSRLTSAQVVLGTGLHIGRLRSSSSPSLPTQGTHVPLERR